MRKTLYEISKEHNIPATTLRVAIHRRLIAAEKVGHIRMIEDQSEDFQNYLAHYTSRNTRPVLKATGKLVEKSVHNQANQEAL